MEKKKYYKPAQSTLERQKALSQKRKRCGKCGVSKDHSEYYNDRSQYDGLSNSCRPCKRNQQDEWRAENPERFRESNAKSALRARMKRYGITEDEYLSLLSAQNNKCAICHNELQPTRHTHIDHCHNSGNVRGLLCSNCNKGLGMFKDNPEYLRSAANYLSD